MLKSLWAWQEVAAIDELGVGPLDSVHCQGQQSLEYCCWQKNFKDFLGKILQSTLKLW